MALANIAWRMADRQGQRVLVVDWDLEAPGLHDFWGFTADELARARGVLDFLLDWRNAVRTKAPAAPDVRSSILPITRRPHAPRFGSLSFLPAGRLDADFEGRLASFDWQEFYEKDRGAVAIETLRRQITEDFDIVLVDSRTGLTDTGGICTIQLPDGVVLLTAPNEQSFRGIERIAQGIVGAPSSQRGGREAPHLWLVPSRISVVEEGYLAEEWYRKYETDFNQGMKGGLWKKEDHPSGLRSHEIPFRARWSFGEQLLHDASGVSDKEILVRAYDQLAETLRQWQLGVDIAAALPNTASHTSIAILETRIEEAERRGDIPGLGEALLDLGREISSQHEHDKAMAVLERAAGIFQGRGDHSSYSAAMARMASVRLTQGNSDEAKMFLEQALAAAETSDAVERQVGALGQLAIAESVKKNVARASELRERMTELAKSLRIPQLLGLSKILSASSLAIDGYADEARHEMQEGLVLAGDLLTGADRNEYLAVLDVFAARATPSPTQAPEKPVSPPDGGKPKRTSTRKPRTTTTAKKNPQTIQRPMKAKKS